MTRAQQSTGGQNRPSISVVIPAKNEEQHLPALLKSLTALTYPSEQLEVIVIDHESTDGTRLVAERYGVRVVTKKGGTISSVRNFGASIASGEILAFLDGDCVVAEDWLSRAVEHFQDPMVGAVGSYHIIPLDPPTWVRKVQQKEIETRPTLSEAKWLPSGNMVVRRDVFHECGGFDESLATCEDVDLTVRIAEKHRVIADMKLRCWHHGAPKTLWEVFRKELWRGRDNFLGAFRHGLKLAELPSLVLPMYFVLAIALFAVSGLMWTFSDHGSLFYVLGAGMALFVPILALSLLMSARIGSVQYLFHFAVFYFVYFLARGLAPAYAWRNF